MTARGQPMVTLRVTLGASSAGTAAVMAGRAGAPRSATTAPAMAGARAREPRDLLFDTMAVVLLRTVVESVGPPRAIGVRRDAYFPAWRGGVDGPRPGTARRGRAGRHRTFPRRCFP